jgi:hypothetical protein
MKPEPMTQASIFRALAKLNVKTAPFEARNKKNVGKSSVLLL